MIWQALIILAATNSMSNNPIEDKDKGISPQAIGFEASTFVFTPASTVMTFATEDLCNAAKKAISAEQSGRAVICVQTQ